jgi:hypothetical protein
MRRAWSRSSRGRCGLVRLHTGLRGVRCSRALLYSVRCEKAPGTPSSSCAARHHTIPRHRPLYTRSSMLLAWSGPAGPQWGSSSGLQTYYGVMFCDVCERSVGHAACNEALRSESVSLVTCGVTPRCHHPITLVSPNDSEAIIS